MSVGDVALQQDGPDVLVPVRARPRARREGLVGVHAGALKIATTVPPEDGRATRRVGELLAAALGVPTARVTCVAGASARDKRYRVHGLDLAAARTRLAGALA